MAGSLQGAWDLHRRVPPERWGITRHELQEFAAEVHQLWLGGHIPNSLDFPNEMHDDPSHGPNLHQVNAYVVKPQTLMAGGMSYALMKHPEGLTCQVFVSHCWDGGIFHLNSSICSAWPRSQRLRNLYCCLLANPQNLDINAFIGGNLMDSAFAKALAKASHLLVVPNPTVAVYSRLWCVFEAYLGVQWNKIYLLPIQPARPMVREFWWKNCGQFLLGGMVIGCPAFWFLSVSVPLTSIWGQLHSVAFAYRSVSLCWQVLILPCSRAKYATESARAISLIGGMMIMLAWYWSCIRQKTEVRNMFLIFNVVHYGWLANMALMNCFTSVLLAFKIFEAKEFDHQEEMMHFESLNMAHCSNQKDEDRIRAEIRGSEGEVETVIRILIHSGAYTDRLRHLWDSGKSIHQKGSTDFTIATAWAMLVWVFSALDCISCVIVSHSSSSIAFGLATGCVLMVLLILISVPYFQRKGPDQAVMALRGWQITGMISLQLPCILKLLVGGDDIACPSMRRCHTVLGWLSLEAAIFWVTLPVKGICIVSALALIILQGIYYDLGCSRSDSQLLLDAETESVESCTSSTQDQSE